MTLRQGLCILLLVAIGVTMIQPARAEALEPTTVLLIIGGVVVLVAIVAVVIIANIREHQRGVAADSTKEPAPVQVVFQSP